MLTNKKALIYCRVSSDRQAEEGHGLDGQEQRCQKYAQGKGYSVVKVFRDKAVSGGVSSRPAMNCLLQYLEKHPNSKFIVLIDDLSRLARDLEVHIQLRAQLSAQGVELECLNHKLDGSLEGMLVEKIFAVIHEYQRKSNTRQVNQKMRARVERGYWAFHPPTGYEFRKTSEHGKLLHPIESDKRALKKALEGFANGVFLTQEDVRKFLDGKIKTRAKDNKVHPSLVKRILTEILYTGYIEYPRWKIARLKAKHEGIIDIEIYDRIQERLSKTERQSWKTDSLKFPLRRFVDCAVCETTMTASRVKGKTKYYFMYTCNNAECSANPKNIQKHLIENEYVRLLKSLIPEKEILQFAERVLLDLWENSEKDYVLKKRESEQLLRQNETEVERYINLIPKAKSDVVVKRYEVKIESLEKENSKLENVTQNKKQPHFEEALREVFDFVRTPDKYWEEGDIEAKKLIQALIFPVNPKYDKQNGFGTPEIALPFRLKQLSGYPKSQLVEVAGFEPASKGAK